MPAHGLIIIVPSSLSSSHLRILGELVRHRPERPLPGRVQVHILQRQDTPEHVRRGVRVQPDPDPQPLEHGEGVQNSQGRRDEPRSVLQDPERLLRGGGRQRRRRFLVAVVVPAAAGVRRAGGAREPVQPLPGDTCKHQGVGDIGSRVGGRREHHTDDNIERLPATAVELRLGGGEERQQQQTLVEECGGLHRGSKTAFPLDGQPPHGHGLAGVHQGAELKREVSVSGKKIKCLFGCIIIK